MSTTEKSDVKEKKPEGKKVKTDKSVKKSKPEGKNEKSKPIVKKRKNGKVTGPTPKPKVTKKTIRKAAAKKSKEILNKRCRLYVKAIFTGFKRGQRNQYPKVTLLKIDGAVNKEDAAFYVGKRCAYMFKCKRGSINKFGKRTNIRIIWGKVTRTHGNSGCVRAKFATNLPPQYMAHGVRIMMYPSRNI